MEIFNFSLLGDIVKYAFGSIVLGIILTLIFVFLLYFLIHGFYPKSKFKPLSLVVGVLLTFMLIPQMIQLCGAVALKGKCDDVVVWLDSNVVHSRAFENPELISTEESSEIVDVLIQQYPFVSTFVGSGWFEGFDTSNICQAIGETLNSFLNKYIWKSIGWSLLYVVIASFIVIQSINRSNKLRSQYFDSYGNNSSYGNKIGDSFSSDSHYSSGSNSGAF